MRSRSNITVDVHRKPCNVTLYISAHTRNVECGSADLTMSSLGMSRMHERPESTQWILGFVAGTLKAPQSPSGWDKLLPCTLYCPCAWIPCISDVTRAIFEIRASSPTGPLAPLLS